MAYTEGNLRGAVACVLDGRKIKDASDLFKIPYTTLRRKVSMARKNQPIENRRRGPAPTLPPEIESDLVDWIIGQQLEGFPATRSDVIVKGTKLLNVVQEGTLSDGWYKRFSDRHPELAERHAQVICRVRNQVSDDIVVTTYNTMLAAIETYGLSASRIYNVDGTGFYTRQRSTRVLALKGSRNVWTHEAPPSFHLTIVACGNAAGDYIPPTFMLAGQRLQRSLLDSLTVPQGQITTTINGFMTMALFMKWLSSFNSSIPANVERPVLLVMDGCSSHYSKDIVSEALKMGVLLMCLPANATHLFQPLDVAVFGPFKKSIREKLRKFVSENGFITMSKPTALSIGCAAWRELVHKKHVEAGFRTAGLFPASLEAMRARLKLYQENGVKDKVTKAAWLTHRDEIRDDILSLPPKRATQNRKRKTIDVAGRLLTVELLAQIEAGEAEVEDARQATKPKQKPRDVVVV